MMFMSMLFIAIVIGSDDHEMTVFVHSHSVPSRAVDIPSAATVGDVRRLISAMPEFDDHPSLEFGGQRLNDDEAPIANVGICSESMIEVIAQQMNDLRLFDACIANTKSRKEIWLLTTKNFSSYEEFAEHHQHDHKAMLEDINSHERIPITVELTGEGEIKITEIIMSGFDDDSEGLDLNGMDFGVLAGMEFLELRSGVGTR